MKAIDYAQAVKMHKDKFGVEPVITGVNFWQSQDTLEKIVNAIDSGKPYEEKEVPKGAVI